MDRPAIRWVVEEAFRVAGVGDRGTHVKVDEKNARPSDVFDVGGGTSNLAADPYAQACARSYGLRTGVFRMSCIYGTRQFGMEDQGWVAHFAISSFFGRPLTIYGDGKQVRDVLFVDDLVSAYEAYLDRSRQLGGRVLNMGGGPTFTMSLLELLSFLEKGLGRKIPVSYGDWRPADQKVYISDIRKAHADLGWTPKVRPEEGVNRILDWIKAQPLRSSRDPRPIP